MLNLTRRLSLCAATLGSIVLAYVFFSLPAKPQVARADGTIQGYVAALLAPQGPQIQSVRTSLLKPQSVSLNAPIPLPDINVVAKSVNGSFSSSPVVTNPQGFFVITGLQEGVYQICVSGTGYLPQCDPGRINVGHFPVDLDHLVPIQPASSAFAGTVWLADRTTPCFWFRPSMDPQPLLAKVSLVDGRQHVVAGPVRSNALGQYVLPVSGGPADSSLHAVCEGGSADVAAQVQSVPALQDLVINNHVPQILTMDITKGSVGVRRVNPGDVVRVTVRATDLDGDTLHYRWVDDSGRNLGLPDAPAVDWPVLGTSTLNTLHVQVSDGKGGITTFSRSLRAGTDALTFAGRVFDRQTLAPVSIAAVSLNQVVVKTDAKGNFRVSVPDADQFVLNVTKPGFALASLILRTRATNIEVPLDTAQAITINANKGGSIQFLPPGCNCRCQGPKHGDHHEWKWKDWDRDKDKDKDDKDKDGHSKKGQGNSCGTTGGGQLTLQFPPGALVDSKGATYKGTATIEGFQYDLAKPNPIPGDFGAVYQGRPVRMASFGSFHIVARDNQGNVLKMATNKKVNVSVPIQTAQLGVAPATIPFFHYDEGSGKWLEDGTLSRNGNQYTGSIAHFSAFNADTIFDGGACVKVVLDNSFIFPVTLNATYFDPASGTFNHPNTQSNDPIIGVERMTPNVNFTLTITDSNSPPAVVSVPLNSGPGLDPVTFPGGLDTDQVNFSHCNGPVQISNSTIPGTLPSYPYFLGKVYGGSITDNSNNYQTVTDAQPGGSRDTLVHWKQANGFLPTPTGEAKAIYFNNGDLKFGRDMHCRVTNLATNALACYVSNFGNVGTDDASTALADAEAYEASGQVSPQPGATVAMEYDPVKGVQFWAYHGEVAGDGGKYFPNPALDDQGNKSMPDICMGCHHGSYSGSTVTGVAGAVFLPFDLDSFKDDTDQLFPANPPSAAVQTQFHLLNNMIANTSPPTAVSNLVNQLWYPGGTGSAVPFTFGRGAKDLSGTPFSGHEPLYDTVVSKVCRTCHVASAFVPWDTFSGMSGDAPSIQQHACAPWMNMPNAEVPWKNYWQQNKNATLASELNFGVPGCPNH